MIFRIFLATTAFEMFNVENSDETLIQVAGAHTHFI